MSKRLSSSYRSGKAKCWIKVKNPKTPAIAPPRRVVFTPSMASLLMPCRM